MSDYNKRNYKGELYGYGSRAKGVDYDSQSMRDARAATRDGLSRTSDAELMRTIKTYTSNGWYEPAHRGPKGLSPQITSAADFARAELERRLSK